VGAPVTFWAVRCLCSPAGQALDTPALLQAGDLLWSLRRLCSSHVTRELSRLCCSPCCPPLLQSWTMGKGAAREPAVFGYPTVRCHKRRFRAERDARCRGTCCRGSARPAATRYVGYGTRPLRARLLPTAPDQNGRGSRRRRLEVSISSVTAPNKYYCGARFCRRRAAEYGLLAD
jgi:hypothetical protein